MKILYFGCLLLVRRIVAELDASAVQQSLEWRNKGMVIRRGGPLDLRLGVAAKASGFLEWERWYAPGIETATEWEKENPDAPFRNYSKDCVAGRANKGLLPPVKNDARVYKQRFHQALIDMFISTGGTFSPLTKVKDSFYHPIDENEEFKGRRPQFLALLMAMGLGIQKSLVYRKTEDKKTNMCISDDQAGAFEIKKDRQRRLARVITFFNAGEECCCRDPRSASFLLSKELLLQVFMLFSFDSADEVHDFYGHVYNLVMPDGRIFSRCFAEDGAEDETRGDNSTAKMYSLVMKDGTLETAKTLPFTMLSQIPSQGTVPRYNREDDEFHPSETFSDCVEATALVFLCCLFYVPGTNSYDLRGCGEASRRSRLTTFFKNRGHKPFVFTQKVRDEWARVTGEVRDPSIRYYNEVAGKDGFREGLSTGLVNFMRVLVHVTGLDPNEYLPDLNTSKVPDMDDKEGDNMLKTFKKKFEQLVNKLSIQKVHTSFSNEMRIFHFQNPYHWDLISTARFSMQHGTEWHAIFSLMHNENHAYVKIIKSPELIGNDLQQRMKKDAMALIAAPTTDLDYLMAASVLNLFAAEPVCDADFAGELMKCVGAENHKKLFIMVPLLSDEQKVFLLQHVTLHDETQWKLRQFINNILNSLPVQTRERLLRMRMLQEASSHRSVHASKRKKIN